MIEVHDYLQVLGPYVTMISPYLPPGVVGIWRWSVWVVKKIVSKGYRPTPKNGYQSTLSIVVPVYNENPDFFEKALSSWQSNAPEEIIAVIDYTDQACIDRFKTFQAQHPNANLIVTKRPGKREALSDGIKAAKYNIIALVDSDTVWEANIKEKLFAPFIDPLVGGVAPRQSVLDPNTLARKIFNIYLDQRYFDEIPYIAVASNALTCISGRTAVYRKEAINDLCDKLENEIFWGVKCISGDDKCLTRLIQEKGWKARYQANARVFTLGAADLSTLFKQYLRWTRNTYRSDIKSLLGSWIWKKEKFLALQMIDAKTEAFTLMIGPIYFILSIIWGHWLVAVTLFLWWHISRAIKLFSHFKNRPSDIKILTLYIFFTYLLAVVKIYAFITIRQQGWITRWDKHRMHSKVGRVMSIAKAIFPYVATGLVLVLLGFSVIRYKGIIKAAIYHQNVAVTNQQQNTTESCQNLPEGSLATPGFGYYTIEAGDTLAAIARKYNSNLSVIASVNQDNIVNPNHIKAKQTVKIPTSQLQYSITQNVIVPFAKPIIAFDVKSNTIYLEGRGSLATLPKIYQSLHNPSALEKLNDKEWILKANLLVKRGVTLVIDGSDVAWLKMKSDSDGFVWLQSRDGNILVKDTKITSWDQTTNAPDTQYENGRSFILAGQNGRMDIQNSQVLFLGYENGLKSGVAWQAMENNSQHLVTGQVSHSLFSNNYSGMYLSAISGVTIADNEIAYNTTYDIDVRNGANDLVLKGNQVHDNGKHSCLASF